MANLQLANKCNLFSYGFAEKKQEVGQKLKELYQKPFRFWQKTQGFEKKTQGHEALLGLLGLKKVHKKQACFKITCNVLRIK